MLLSWQFYFYFNNSKFDPSNKITFLSELTEIKYVPNGEYFIVFIKFECNFEDDLINLYGGPWKHFITNSSPPTTKL